MGHATVPAVSFQKPGVHRLSMFPLLFGEPSEVNGLPEEEMASFGSKDSVAEGVLIDATTSVPKDLFEELRVAGRAARARGQHRRIRGFSGSATVRHADLLDANKPGVCTAKSCHRKCI